MVAGPCNPSYSRGWGGRITWTQQMEVAVSRDHTTALQHGRQSEMLSQRNKTNQKIIYVKCLLWPGAVAHAYNPSISEANRSPEVEGSRPAWPTWWNPTSIKNTKISQVWWCASMIPATREAEAGESLEPGRWRLQWAELEPLHLDDKKEAQSQNK